jgi:hypothetical protein
MASDPDQFFVLLSGGIGTSHDTEMLESDPVVLGDAPRCDACGLYVGGRPWLPPHRVELTLHGEHWGDFAFRGDGGEDMLMSERAAAAYQDAGLTGLTGFEEVEVTRLKGLSEQPPRYLHVAVPRGSAAVDEKHSKLIRNAVPTCSQCRSATLEGIQGFALERGAWSGEDVFFPRGLTGTAVATRRFVDFVREHGLTNVRFAPSESYVWDPYAPVSGDS